MPLAVPNIGELERRYVLEAVESGFVSSVGPFVSEFERRFADHVGSTHAIACSTGTAAIHIGLLLLGVGPGDEVVCSDFTFVGSVNPIAYLGARPVLVDSEERTWNLDPALLAAELDRRAAAGEPLPAAVEVVHVLGQPADIEPVVDACARHGIPVLEDAAESLGATWTSGRYAGRHTGTVGRGRVLLLQRQQDRDDRWRRHDRHRRRRRSPPGRATSRPRPRCPTSATSTTRSATTTGSPTSPRGSGSPSSSGWASSSRPSTASPRATTRRFADLPLALPPREPGLDATYWLYSVLVPRGDGRGRDELLAHLAARGIGARALWRPLHAQPPFAGADARRRRR